MVEVNVFENSKPNTMWLAYKTKRDQSKTKPGQSYKGDNSLIKNDFEML